MTPKSAPAGAQPTTDLPDPYLVNEWGEGYFSVDAEGFVRVHGEPGSDPSIRIADVVGEMRRRGFRSPFVLRFPQILKHRVKRLHHAFRAAIKEFEYPEGYQGVYPVKVNQQRQVVEALLSETHNFHYGIEVGSKGELVLGLTQTLDDDALIICNGFKDRDYIELAVRAGAAGLNVLIICETLHEVHEAVAVSKKLGVKPRIGIRARLHSKGAGQWVESGGAHAKFGLSALEMVQCLDHLEAEGVPEALEILHFHIGSQINDILAIKEAVKEAAQLYCKLKKRAVGLAWLDMGGGLGVNYDGSSTASDWSHNYSIEEYARDCVYNVLAVCEDADVAPPRLVSESGRAVTAYGTMTAMAPVKVIGRMEGDAPAPVREESCRQVEDLEVTLRELKADRWREAVNEARALHEEIIQGFKLGVIDLEDRAAGEAFFIDICRRALEIMDIEDEDADEVAELRSLTAPMVVCNFSVFQSIPDTWAVRQVFPVVPLSQIHSDTHHQFTIGDITCDSDGRIDDFLNEAGVGAKTLQLPKLDLKNPYLIGIFLTGAYQDTLGDYHNLFGSANEAAVWISGENKFELSGLSRGTTVSEALAPFGYEPGAVVSSFDDRYGGDDSPEILRFRDCFLRVLSSGSYLRR